MNVLLVDDHLEVQNTVRATLCEAGYTVLPVHDGLSGIDAAIDEKPDLILADFNLAGLDISDFIARIRRRAFLIPILLLTDERDAISSSSLEIQAVVKKPLDPTLLLSEVTRQIGPAVKECPLPESSPVEHESPLEDLNNKVTDVMAALETDEFLRKTILDVVEKVSWDVIPGVLEAALPKETVHAIVERVVWETVPSIAEIEIKKEIQRLQSE